MSSKNNMNLFRLLWPGTIYFPIFWFPLLIPLLTGFIVVLIDGLLIANSSSGFDKLAILGFGTTAFTTIQTSFLSTDVWALTTILMSSAKRQLNGALVWGHSFAVIIGLFVHLTFIVATKLLSHFPYFFWWLTFLALVGFIGAFWIRGVVYNYIEKFELEAVASSE
ncbi:hypothetical protein QRL16_004492 [Vibrio parahaemolyticus]|nr:hypothetical protein [Vibrio parahaemolyticus]